MNINMNKKKRKIDEAFDPDYDYVYGIVSTGTDWYFILHRPRVSIVLAGPSIESH